MAVKIFHASEAIHEQSDAQYECTFIEAAPGQPTLDAAAILTITATLKDQATGTIINSRNAQDVNNANGGVLVTNGTFTLTLGGLDNIIVTATGDSTVEEHRLTIEATFTRTGGGVGPLNHEIRFYVRKLADVP